jgi:hypothetical protein
VWDGQDPLAQRNSGRDAIDEVRGEVRHATADTRGTEPAALTRERDGTRPAAVAAPRQHEAVRQDPAAQERLDFGHDECGQRRFGVRFEIGEERLPVRLHGRVQDRLLGPAPA